MPLSKQGRYIANPRQGHFKERGEAKPAQEAKPASDKIGMGHLEHEGEGKHITHTAIVHKHSDGSHSVVTHHHGSGAVQHHEHANFQEMHDAMPQHMGESGQEESEESPEFQAGEEEALSKVAIGKSDSGAY